MSEIRLNVLGADGDISGTIHGSMADYIVAGLSADPETIEELEEAIGRFIRPGCDGRAFELFDSGIDERPWDAGIMFIDLPARMVATESTYSNPGPEGEVLYRDGRHKELWLPYLLSDEWIFPSSIDEYETTRRERRSERNATPPIDARSVLYGAFGEFAVKQCLVARDSGMKDPIAEIHTKWLMTPRPDLAGHSPREWMLVKRDFIDADLWSRERQWSSLNEPPPCLKPESAAYRFAGFGTHSFVVYYDLLRTLLTECWKRVLSANDTWVADEVVHLERVMAEWLENWDPEIYSRSPAFILECERKRLPLIASPEELLLDEDCPCCRWMSENYTPTFCHLDGSHMDIGFAFSFCRTQDEWEEEERSREELYEELERQYPPDASRSSPK
jgi:hypothetical protein